MDLTRKITNNHKRLYEVNQSTSNQQIDINEICEIGNNTENLNQYNIDQFEDAVSNVLIGIKNTYDRKNFKGGPKFALFRSYCSSHGHTKGRYCERPQREQQQKPQERSFYGHMRKNQNLPNRQISSNNVIGRQLPPTSPIYNNHRSRTPNRSSRYPSNQSNKSYNNNSRYLSRSYSINRSYRNNRSYSNNRSRKRYDNNNRNSSQSYNRNNNNNSKYSNNRNCSNSYHRNNNYNRPNYNKRSNSRNNLRSPYHSRSPYNRNINSNNNNNNNNGNRYNSNDRNRHSSNRNQT